MRKLTTQQNLFICELLSGKTQEEAYASAYPKSVKWDRGARDVEACKLLKLPHVSYVYSQEKEKRDKEQRDLAKKKNLWSKQKSIEALVGLINLAFEDVKAAKKRQKEEGSEEPALTMTTANTVIKSVVELNKITGETPEDDVKTIAEVMLGLNPDSIKEDPKSYTAPIPLSSIVSNKKE